MLTSRKRISSFMGCVIIVNGVTSRGDCLKCHYINCVQKLLISFAGATQKDLEIKKKSNSNSSPYFFFIKRTLSDFENTLVFIEAKYSTLFEVTLQFKIFCSSIHIRPELPGHLRCTNVCVPKASRSILWSISGSKIWYNPVYGRDKEARTSEWMTPMWCSVAVQFENNC